MRGDTLREPKFLDDAGASQRFDVVIANPPFSLKNWGAEIWTTTRGAGPAAACRRPATATSPGSSTWSRR